MDRKKDLAHLQEKGYMVIGEGQVALGSKVFDICEGPQKTAMGVQDSFCLKLHEVDKERSMVDRLADAGIRSKDEAKSSNVMVLSFLVEIGFTQFSVSAAWYEKQEDKDDVAGLFEQASFDEEESGFRDVTGKDLDPEI